jgi:hypothetical protein
MMLFQTTKQFSDLKSLRVQAKQIKLESSRDHSLSLERSGMLSGLFEHRKSINNLTYQTSMNQDDDNSFYRLLSRNINDSLYIQAHKPVAKTFHNPQQAHLSPTNG